MAKGPPRALLIGLVALGGLALAGGGTVWAHYRSTPTFREWARATPVDDAVWRAHVPAGVELGHGTRWRSDDGPARERAGQWRARFTAKHGDERLLDLEIEVRVESREVDGWLERGVPSEAFEGLEAFVIDRGHDPDFHGVAVLTLLDLTAYADRDRLPEMTQGPSMQLDVFALSGPGDVELVVQEVPWTTSGREGPWLDGRQFDGASGFVEACLQTLALPDPPEGGLAYQARAGITPNWSRNGQGGSQSASRPPSGFATNAQVYSTNLELMQAYRMPFDPPDHFGLTATLKASRAFVWNGEVW